MNSKNLIALLTDFGTRDYFVGALKGAILSVNARANIIDITHEIHAQDISSASFTLRVCYRNFPAKTIFVAVVDPGVGSARRGVLVETADYYFVAPDNGLLSFVFNEIENSGAGAVNRVRVFELTAERFFAKNVSRTFHGRDIFAPVAAHLSNGVRPNEFGAEIEGFVCFEESQPRKVSANETEAQIVHTDCFGNLITNLKSEDLPEKFSLEIGGKTISRLRNFFAEAEESEVFMIEGSAGFLEIAAFRDSAAKLLSAANGQKIIVKALPNVNISASD